MATALWFALNGVDANRFLVWTLLVVGHTWYYLYGLLGVHRICRSASW